MFAFSIDPWKMSDSLHYALFKIPGRIIHLMRVLHRMRVVCVAFYLLIPNWGRDAFFFSFF